jgi:hypothetical protein
MFVYNHVSEPTSILSVDTVFELTIGAPDPCKECDNGTGTVGIKVLCDELIPAQYPPELVLQYRIPVI